MEPGRFAPGTCVQLSGRIRIPKIQPKKLTRGPSRCWAQMCTRCVLNLCDHHFVPQIGSTQWCTCTCSALNPYDTHFVPYIGGIQWCTCTGSILSEMCDNHSVLHIGSIQWRMCTCSVFDSNCVTSILCRTLNWKHPVTQMHLICLKEKVWRHPVVHVYLLCFQTVVQPFCTVHWKHPVVVMHRLCVQNCVPRIGSTQWCTCT